MKEKLTSRKFWVCVAAVLASLGTGISGIIQGNETLAIIGSCLTVVSAAIYAGVEAYVDGKAVDEKTTVHFVDMTKKEGE